MENFFRSDLAATEMLPIMWLSAVDFTQKVGMDDLSDFCTAMFYDKFEWDELHTTSLKN